MNAQEPKATLTVEETAKILNQGKNQTYEAVRRGDIPAIRIGNRWHVLAGPLKRMLGVEKPEAAKSDEAA